MTLIKSISGIRGTIGGKPGEGLSPLDVVKYTASYASWAKHNARREKLKIVVGRDARISGEMVGSLVVATLCGMGCDVINMSYVNVRQPSATLVHQRFAESGSVLRIDPCAARLSCKY